MSKTIEIDGTIGWDVWPSMISEKLKEANGEDVEILFSSPGGFIDDGLAIFNLIHDYQGKTTAKIIGMAASMASYIPLAADKVIAKSNAVYMIHDALAGLYGNESEHEKIAKILGGFSNLLADIYVKKTGKTKDEIRGLMRAETYYFGPEILDAGFVDEIDDIDVSNPDKDETVLEAMARVEMTVSKVKERPENYSKIAALISKEVFTPPERPAFSNIHTEDKTMDIKELEAKYPDVYKAVYDIGKTDGEKASNEQAVAAAKAEGIQTERVRMNAIDELMFPPDFATQAKKEGWQPEQAALNFQKIDAANRKQTATNIESGLNDAVNTDAPEPPKPPDGGKAKTPEQEWEANAEVRAEFGNDKARYMAFVNADSAGKVKILNRGGKQ